MNVDKLFASRNKAISPQPRQRNTALPNGSRLAPNLGEVMRSLHSQDLIALSPQVSLQLQRVVGNRYVNQLHTQIKARQANAADFVIRRKIDDADDQKRVKEYLMRFMKEWDNDFVKIYHYAIVNLNSVAEAI